MPVAAHQGLAPNPFTSGRHAHDHRPQDAFGKLLSVLLVALYSGDIGSTSLAADNIPERTTRSRSSSPAAVGSDLAWLVFDRPSSMIV